MCLRDPNIEMSESGCIRASWGGRMGKVRDKSYRCGTRCGPSGPSSNGESGCKPHSAEESLVHTEVETRNRGGEVVQMLVAIVEQPPSPEGKKTKQQNLCPPHPPVACPAPADPAAVESVCKGSIPDSGLYSLPQNSVKKAKPQVLEPASH